MGRKCARNDSKEIFVVEEPNSRVSGTVVKTTGLLPRAVITGCNTDRANPDSVKKSFELMAALVSNPDSAAAKAGNAMVFTPLEVMALDRRTGTYNFYVFDSNGAGKTGTITRLIRDVKACNARNTSEADAYALDIVKLASQRRKEFVEIYEQLVESQDLLPTDKLTDTKVHAFRLNATTCKLEAQ